MRLLPLVCLAFALFCVSDCSSKAPTRRARLTRLFGKRDMYPHPVTSELVPIHDYVTALEEMLAESEGMVKKLTNRIMGIRGRLFKSTTEGTREYLSRIVDLQRVIDELTAKLAQQGDASAAEMKEAMEKQAAVVKEIKDSVMRIYKEELADVRDEMSSGKYRWSLFFRTIILTPTNTIMTFFTPLDTVLEKKLDRQRQKFDEELANVKAKAQKDLHSVVKQKDEVISKERSKVVRVLQALQEAEVKRKEYEVVTRRMKEEEKAQANGANRGGKSVVGKDAEKVKGRLLTGSRSL